MVALSLRAETLDSSSESIDFCQRIDRHITRRTTHH